MLLLPKNAYSIETAKTALVSQPLFYLRTDREICEEYRVQVAINPEPISLPVLMATFISATDGALYSVGELLIMIGDNQWVEEALLPNLHLVKEYDDAEDVAELVEAKVQQKLYHNLPVDMFVADYKAKGMNAMLEQMDTEFTFHSIEGFYQSAMVVLTEHSAVSGEFTAFAPIRPRIMFAESHVLVIENELLTPIQPGVDDFIVLHDDNHDLPYRIVSLSKAISTLGATVGGGLVFNGFQYDPRSFVVANEPESIDTEEEDTDEDELAEEESLNAMVNSEEFKAFEDSVSDKVENSLAFEVETNSIVNDLDLPAHERGQTTSIQHMDDSAYQKS